MIKLASLFKTKKVFIPYITAGDPDLTTTEALIHTLAKAGADAIELGIPFSDPIADGPVIQKAHNRALASGTTLARIIALVKQIRLTSDIPLIFMMSYNSIVQYKIKPFIKDIKAIQLNGLIVPDLPFEESANLAKLLKAVDIPLISFIAPTTSQERIKKISRNATGFIYLISSTGVTGVRQAITTKLQETIKQIRHHTNTPIAIGFGISGPEMARTMAELADGIIVGSAIVKIVEEKKDQSSEAVYQLAAEIKKSIG